MSTHSTARFSFFVVAGAFVLLGPIAVSGPKRPWLPIQWRVYQGAGVNYCQANLQAVRNGARGAVPQDALVRAVGRAEGRTRRRGERFSRKARAHDVLFANEGELAAVVKALCETEPDVRAEMRCSPAYPGGHWRAVEDGATNLCERKTWTLSSPRPSGALPNLDPETGEEILPDPPEP